MDAPAPDPALAAQPVAVAALTRTSTLDLQDPVAFARRQLRAISDWLPAGWYLAAVYSDVESGATDLDGRSQGEAWRILTDAGLPRDGGMADLLDEAASPSPRFSVVVVEDIERASRDFYDSVKLERKLGRQGIPLLATDEPADITGLNATTVLVRRVKQGVAEWYRIQLKAKTRKGLEQHAIDGYNNGRVPYGYLPDRIAHPVAVKAGQGRVRTLLAVDPQAGPWVTRMFEWRVLERLSREAIAARLGTDDGREDPGQPQVHRVHGVRADEEHRQVPAARPTQGPRRAPRPVDLVPGPGPPRAGVPPAVGRSPEDRRRPRGGAGYRGAHQPRRAPVPAALTAALLAVRAANDRLHPARAARGTVLHLLRVSLA
jgi:DNA invertase Pin-like site-specific DNA recombinase